MSLPEIVKLESGKITVKIYETEKTYKNCRIWAFDSDEWPLGFHPLHPPVIQFSDFADLFQRCPQAEYLILATGINKMLPVYPETLKRVSQKYPHIKVLQLKTKHAVMAYNQLKNDHQVVGLFYTT
jgi:hypothetical protein